MREFLLKNKYLCSLWLLTIIAILVFTGHYAEILLDVGREVYYPEQILQGKVLYKDLFCIYGPFSYLWNSFLYLIMGKNLTTLYISGAICSLGIVTGVYLISRKFLTEFLSFTIALFTIATGVCAPNLFNFTFPYSWAILYGTLGFLFSAYFLVKFKISSNQIFLYLSALLVGFCVANKYEYIFYALLVLIIAISTKNKKFILNSITSFAIIPLISFGILFLQGLTINDLILSSSIIKKIMNSKTLEYFYKTQGVFFNPTVFLVWGISFGKFLLSFGGLLLSGKILEKNRVWGIILICIFTATSICFANFYVFIFLIPLVFILSIVSYKKLKLNLPLFIFVLSAMLVSIKSFWGLSPVNYGNYCVSAVLIAFLSVLFTLFDNKYQKFASVFLIIVSLFFVSINGYKRSFLTTKIQTTKGSIYTGKKTAVTTNELIKFLENKKDKSVVIFPEGLLINFLTQTKSDDYYNSMLPLYTETFGDNSYIENFQKTKPEFIILNNHSMKDYYFEYICENYAHDFCNYVTENYTQELSINKGFNYLVYRRK